ncbi:MAG: hypothetical protein ABR529_00300 [Actinomycetota bacterium]
MAKDETVKKATGRTQAQWYTLLDKWGAPGRPYREIAKYLTDIHGVSRWWAQKLIVEYEQDRGVREPGARRNARFEVSASKTVNVPVKRLFDAFVDSHQRRRWIAGGSLRIRASVKGRSARFDWNGGSSRVTATFSSKGIEKASVLVAHDLLTDGREAQKMKAFWREHLVELKETLES